ncbi:hypothetical protein MJ561_21715 [Klebsiella pneumoniae]|nr:hypothetical protein MJ561_21715 [Klebsiella pneumoniae]
MKELTERNGFASCGGYAKKTSWLAPSPAATCVSSPEDQPVSVYMTPKSVWSPFVKAKAVKWSSLRCTKNALKALVVDGFHLRGMITRQDFQKAERKPNACKDEQGRSARKARRSAPGAGNERARRRVGGNER